jgi:hypothetical protein
MHRFLTFKKKSLPLIDADADLGFGCCRVAAHKKAATPFSAAAVASPPDTAAGRRSSNSYPASVSRGLTHLWRTSLIEKIAVRKISCKDF